MMLNVYERLLTGDKQQKQAYEVIMHLNVLHDLKAYNPILCGTFPLGIHTSKSDLDIILHSKDLRCLEQKLKRLYSHHESFTLKRKYIRERKVLKVNFIYQSFSFELFAQNQPVNEQYAYLHMIIEEKILLKYPEWKQKVIHFKQSGVNTEVAFCKLLGLEGDPFEALIQYGKQNHIIA